MIMQRTRRLLATTLKTATRSLSDKPTRRPNFAVLSPSHVQYFRDQNIVCQTEELEPYNVDWLGKYTGSSPIVLKPKSTAQVAAILAYCHEQSLAIVPQGGNTGLVGGSVPVHDELILSLSRLSSTRVFDAASGILTCDAGYILESLSAFLSPYGYMMPLDLGAKGSCHIGGNVATNAGGLRLLRYGNLHGSIVGLEVVLANGDVLNTLSLNRKDNTGVDLKQLFIGSEGTLGIITQVAILAAPLPQSIKVAWLACPTFEAAVSTMARAKSQLGEILSAVEFIDRPSLDLVLMQQPEKSVDPLDTVSPFYLLVETSGSGDVHDGEKLDAFLDLVMTQELVSDGVVAQDGTQAAKLFGLREDITLALNARGLVYKYDVSLPLAQYYTLVTELQDKLAVDFPLVIVTGYGHLGDGNLHLNISTASTELDSDLQAAIEPFVFDFVTQHHGSISAEHGVGLQKAAYLPMAKSEVAIQLMRHLKTVMDPKGILNPYKMLPEVVASSA